MNSIFSLPPARRVVRLAALLLLFAPISSVGAPAQQPIMSTAGTNQHQATERRRADRTDAIDRPVSDPYKGDLSIFEDAERDRKLQINRVMDILGVRAGTSVADIGAGSGWFTVRAARRVGENGKVYAVEINPEAIRYIQNRAQRERLANIRTVLGREDNPLLPKSSVDAVLILKTYHEIAEPVRVLKNLRLALKPGARIGIIDRNGAGDDHGINRKDVLAEAERAGYRLAEEHDFVKPDGMDYFLVFEARQ